MEEDDQNSSVDILSDVPPGTDDAENAFMIDTEGASPDVRSTRPRYQIGRKSIELTKQEEKSNQRDKLPQYLPNQCWNCGKRTHSLRDCENERNQITIEWNKELHSMNKSMNNQKFSKNFGRYHQTKRMVELYPNVQPGVISPKLRQFLNLSPDELPPYIYCLRELGYPKAWLKHATVRPSGMSLYDAHGNELADPGTEDGEILEEADKIRYDLDKLIRFPGFNSPMPENSIDEYERRNAPPYDPSQSIDLMISQLKEKSVAEYRLKKNSVKRKSMNNDESDENIDANPDTSNASKGEDIENGVIPTLSSYSQPDLPPSKKIKRDNTDEVSHLSDNESSIKSESPQSCDTSKGNTLGRILSSCEGTPLLKTKFKHTRLPPSENFSKDICDVLNFENLPESTGKFEKMRGLLKKVKQVLGIKR